MPKCPFHMNAEVGQHVISMLPCMVPIRRCGFIARNASQDFVCSCRVVSCSSDMMRCVLLTVTLPSRPIPVSVLHTSRAILTDIGMDDAGRGVRSQPLCQGRTYDAFHMLCLHSCSRVCLTFLGAAGAARLTTGLPERRTTLVPEAARRTSSSTRRTSTFQASARRLTSASTKTAANGMTSSRLVTAGGQWALSGGASCFMPTRWWQLAHLQQEIKLLQATDAGCSNAAGRHCS